MCGLIGHFGSALPEPSARKQAMDRIAARGPDGKGQHEDAAAGLWLGHRRLAIIDPESGQQPMSEASGRFYIVFNGCIYNYEALGAQLRGMGYAFRTHSDTEVILAAYQAFGVDCVRHLKGMFAFALWDAREQTLFCARDPIGIKPFYFCRDSGGFSFGSEIKAVLPLRKLPPRLNPSALQEYLYFQAYLEDATLVEGIERLPAGHYALVSARGARLDVVRYWELDFGRATIDDEGMAIDQLRLRLMEAVSSQLRSDVALGFHLSGGLDSSTVVCLASQSSRATGRAQVFTGAFDEGASYDEREYARLVAERVAAEAHEIVPRVDDFAEHLPKILWHLDEPAAGPGIIPQYFVSRCASRHVKVILGGQGGDELFSGYARHLVAYLEECLNGAVDGTADSGTHAVTLSTIAPGLAALREYKPLLRASWGTGLFTGQSSAYFRLLDRSHSGGDVFDEGLFGATDEMRRRFDAVFNASNAKSLLNRMMHFDFKVLLPALLQVEDRTSMAWGLESRVPLLDLSLVEWSASVSPSIRFQGGELKHLLRRAVDNVVPRPIVRRRDKMGFPVPLDRWLRNPRAREFVLDTFAAQRCRERGLMSQASIRKTLDGEVPYGRALWGALSLELWCRMYIDGCVPTDGLADNAT